MPSAQPVPDIEDQMLRENAVLRAEFFEEVPVLTAAQVGRGQDAGGRAARWAAEGRIFSVPREGTDVFPAFQFEQSGEPRPVIGEILRIVPQEMSPWATALWFVSANGWLDGAMPMESLDDREAVLDAAQNLADPAVG